MLKLSRHNAVQLAIKKGTKGLRQSHTARRTGSTNTQHRIPFADENVLMIDRSTPIVNLALKLRPE
jgi:hypothetical protein